MKSKGLGILLIIFLWSGGAAWGAMTPPSVPGNPSVIPVSYSCYDILTYSLQDCGVSLTLSERTFDGGHAAGHDPGRPLGGLRFYRETGTGNSTLSFRTNHREVGVRYVAPEVSGGVTIEGTISPTPPYFCVSSCRPRVGITVGVERLSRLPEGVTRPYVVVRGDTSTHPEGTYGTQNTLSRLNAIAGEYFKLTDRKLSINDLSLSWGGLFDINNDWVLPHQTHRFGTDADINRTDGGGVFTNCPDDKDLIQSIDKVNRLLPVGKAVRKCENGGYKHVDFY
ncbi:MAG: hypothetical protein HY760_09360 [Nitrospirae bacterium]|nr:hypothetical protein [Nitrospirota bacterium]